MDLVEFAEKISGRKLTVYQKEILKLFSSLPKDHCIVMGRKGPMILDSNGKRIDHVKESYYERNIINCKKRRSM
jgi:hypothetical protein